MNSNMEQAKAVINLKEGEVPVEYLSTPSFWALVVVGSGLFLLWCWFKYRGEKK